MEQFKFRPYSFRKVEAVSRALVRIIRIICCYKSTASRYRFSSVPHRTLSTEAMKWTEEEAQQQQQPIIKKWKNC